MNSQRRPGVHGSRISGRFPPAMIHMLVADGQQRATARSRRLTKPEKFNARAGELSFRDLLGRFWREEPPQRVLADTIALP